MSEPTPEQSRSGAGLAPEEYLKMLFDEHHQRVYRVAYRVTGSASDAEDVLQTIFLRLARRAEPFDLGSTAGSYLHRAAINAGLDLLRARKRSGRVDLEEADSDLDAVDRESAPGPDRRAEGRELGARLRSALGRLNENAAEMFALRYFEGYGNTEIANMLGTSRSTVAVTLHRARSRLKEMLAEA